MNCKTGLHASAKIKKPKVKKISNPEEELEKINREIYCNFCDEIFDEDLWDRKRRILAQIRDS